jgi:hypothetical protein
MDTKTDTKYPWIFLGAGITVPALLLPDSVFVLVSIWCPKPFQPQYTTDSIRPLSASKNLNGCRGTIVDGGDLVGEWID